MLTVKCFYYFHSRHLWFGAAYRPLLYTRYQFFMNVDSTGLEVSANGGGSMFPPRDTIIIAWNWNLKLLPGLYWVLWGAGEGLGKNRIIVLEWSSLTIEWNQHCPTEGEGSNKRSSGEFFTYITMSYWNGSQSAVTSSRQHHQGLRFHTQWTKNPNKLKCWCRARRAWKEDGEVMNIYSWVTSCRNRDSGLCTSFLAVTYVWWI